MSFGIHISAYSCSDGTTIYALVEEIELFVDVEWFKLSGVGDIKGSGIGYSYISIREKGVRISQRMKRIRRNAQSIALPKRSERSRRRSLASAVVMSTPGTFTPTILNPTGSEEFPELKSVSRARALT